MKVAIVVATSMSRFFRLALCFTKSDLDPKMLFPVYTIIQLSLSQFLKQLAIMVKQVVKENVCFFNMINFDIDLALASAIELHS